MKKLDISLEAIERNEMNEKELEKYIREHIDIENVAVDEIIYYSDKEIEIDILRYYTYKEEIILIK